MDKRIGAQYFTIREHLKTMEDFELSCQKISEIGYKLVQISGTPLPSKVWQIAAEAALAEADGTIDGRAVFLIPPGEELPEIGARLYIRQRMNLDELIAAQRYYQVDLGTVLTDGEAIDSGLVPSE